VFIPGLALGATGIVVGRNQGAPAGDSDCHTRNRVLAARGPWLTAVGHLVVVADLVNALGSSPRRPVGHTMLAWSSIAAGLALGAGSYLILNNHGYGQTSYRTLGYADAPLGAAAFAMGVGTRRRAISWYRIDRFPWNVLNTCAARRVDPTEVQFLHSAGRAGASSDLSQGR
jgi:hypothetical protein